MTFGVETAWVWTATAVALALLASGVRARRSLVLWPLAVVSLWALAVRPHLPMPATNGGTPLTIESDSWQGGAAAIALRWPQARRLAVNGHGLRSFDWGEARLEIASFDPPPLPAGLASAHWRRTLPLGQDLIVRGAISAMPDGTEVRLRGPAGVEARTSVEGGVFTVSARPRAAGPVLWAVEAGPASAASWSETLDVEVVPARPPRVLWLETSPSAESAFVRRWVERRGGAIAVRARPSRGRLRTSSTGIEPAPDLRSVDEAELQGFDVVVLDPDAASASELEGLRRAVEAGALGVLWRGRAARSWEHGFEVAPVAGLDSLVARVRAAAEGGAGAEPLALAPLEIRPAAQGQAVLVDSAGRLLAARRLLGAGWSALTLLEGTFRWPLGGHDDDYARVWSELLEAVAPARAAGGWHWPSGPVLVGQPLDLAFDGDVQSPALEDPSGARVPLDGRSDEIEPRRAHFTVWPRAPGWHRAVSGEGGEISAWFYAQEPSVAWRAWQAAHRQEDTRAYAARSRATPPAPERWSPREVPRPLPFAVLVACLGALWSIERFGAVRSGTRPGRRRIARSSRTASGLGR
jgi:hypothetical protein